jgi:tetratricopeptide (TPR) repeat protein
MNRRCYLLAVAAFILFQSASHPEVLAAQAAQQPALSPMSTDNVNAAVTAARAATKEKRYADAEALMLKVTAADRAFVLPWVELGLAQLGLKKYPEAENSFKVALGIDEASLNMAHSSDFYQSPDSKGVAPTATHASRNTQGGVVSNATARTPDVLGVCWASLGEIYALTGKIAESQAAFDTAVKDNPTDAALYRRNQTIFYFQAGNSDAQLDAANKAIALDTSRASNYYFKAQALVGKATMDPKTQKMILPAGCAEAYQKYLALDPNGQFSADAKGVLAAAGLPTTGKK